MNYEELVNQFAKQNNLEYPEAAEFIDAFFAVIKLGMARGEEVKIFRFGTFSQKIIKRIVTKNAKSKKIELSPDEIYPLFAFTRAGEKKKPEKKKAVLHKKESAPKLPAVPKTPDDYIGLVQQYYRKIVIVFVLFLLIYALGLFASYKWIKDSVFKGESPKNFIHTQVKDYLNEIGFTHSAVEEMVDSRYSDVLNRADEYNKELTSNISNQINKIKTYQEKSLKKIESYLKSKVTGMIQPQLKKTKKRAQVQMKLYTVRKNDTLWGISKRYLNNPYNWVGLFHTNGENIKNPNKIFPGQKIFIPVIKEY